MSIGRTGLVIGAAGGGNAGRSSSLQVAGLLALAGIVGDTTANGGGSSDQARQGARGNLSQEVSDLVGGSDGHEKGEGEVLELHFEWSWLIVLLIGYPK